MSLCLKGLIWKDGKFWKAEIKGLALTVKCQDRTEALKELNDKIDEISDDLDYEISADENGLIIFETDDIHEAALLILKQRIQR